MRTMRLLKAIAGSVLALLLTAQGDTFWLQDVSEGAAWSDSGSWSAGLPGTADRANFTNTQETEYDVDVDTNAVFKKILISQSYTYDGTGSIELQPASTAHWDKVIEVNQAAATAVFDADVTITGTSTYVKNIHNAGSLTFNGALALNGVNSNVPANMTGDGTTTINGDLANNCGIRMGGGNLVIADSGVTTGNGEVTYKTGNLSLNRASALLSSAVLLRGVNLSLGADNALVSGTDLAGSSENGTVVANGFDQTFGELDMQADSDIVFDMNGSDSVWTFANSDAAGWGSTATLSITNVGDSEIRFELDSGAGLTAIQIGQISVNGTALSSGDTTTDGGYLYVVKPNIATGFTYWDSDVSDGATWSDYSNWTAGRASTNGRANFVNTQSTTYDVDVDMAAVLQKILVSQDYTFNGAGSLEFQPASTSHWDRVLEVNQVSASTVFHVDVTVQGTTTYVKTIQNVGSLIFNGLLTLNGVNDNVPVNIAGAGTTTINGDLDNNSGIRMGGGNLTIAGSGVTTGSGEVTFKTGNLSLNRASALLSSEVLLRGVNLSLGAENALVAGTDLRGSSEDGTVVAAGYDQTFGTLDLDSGSDIIFDMNDSSSMWTFANSDAAGWDASASLTINNIGDSVVRFELGSGSGLLESQVEMITIDGRALTLADTTVDDGYLYITSLPGATAQYDDWAGEYDLSFPDSDLLSDPDFDGMNNLIEYALGGIPTHSDASAILPVGSLVDNGETLEYVYLRRLDAADRGLTYTVEQNSDLLADESWSTNGITETSGAIDANFESVTNRISTGAADAQFMKLNVEFE